VWIAFMETALQGRPLTDDTPPDGMVRVAVAGNGRLLPEGSGGITEWVKTEDLERMQSWSDWGPDESVPTEEVFDIFSACWRGLRCAPTGRATAVRHATQHGPRPDGGGSHTAGTPSGQARRTRRPAAAAPRPGRPGGRQAARGKWPGRLFAGQAEGRAPPGLSRRSLASAQHRRRAGIAGAPAAVPAGQRRGPAAQPARGAGCNGILRLLPAPAGGRGARRNRRCRNPGHPAPALRRPGGGTPLPRPARHSGQSARAQPAAGPRTPRPLPRLAAGSRRDRLRTAGA